MIPVVRSRPVVLVVYPGIQSLDLVGPTGVFATANRTVRRAKYGLTVASVTDVAGGPVP
jgi:hypothetical protein